MKSSSRPASRVERRRASDRAWRLFVEEGAGPEGVPEEIARSWQRARGDYRIDAGLRRPPRRLTADELRQRCERDALFRLARPVLAEFSERLRLSQDVLTVFDGEGWMLSIDGQPGVVEAVADIDFRPGTCWSEADVGTNGPGTALAEHRPVKVCASEHFVAAWQPWSCSAAPVFAPGCAAPVGAVDITGPWEVQGQRALLAAVAIARSLEERLRAVASVRAEVARHALRAARGSGDALLAVDAGGAVIAANDAAVRRQLAAAGSLPPAIRRSVLRALGSPEAGRDADLRLAVGDGPGLVVSPIAHEGAVVGALLRLPSPPRTTRSRRGEPPEPAPGGGAIAASAALSRYDFSLIQGQSDALARAVDLGGLAARNTLPVVIFGESGTGKELFAHAIHGGSERRDGPFVAVNCGSIPSALVEAELFGYEAGTFTGGRRDGSAGRFEDAAGGTLFLDEVSELSAAAQTALLRVLQEREVVRLGGCAPRMIDVRIVAATNRPLLQEVAAQRFRRDLYYRLNVLAIEIPPLRERGDDILLLARAFLSLAQTELGRTGLTLSAEALSALAAHPWPGNVRELKNVILRAAATSPGTEIGLEELQLETERRPAAEGSPAETGAPAATGPDREALLAALVVDEWNFARTAKRLGISRMTLYRRLARCGISRAARGGGGEGEAAGGGA
ncbi:MAG: sigma-54-dependent Fis family transcriptional regulator [Deltaproteobacteria bacterium]|nr:sigma-54-dependent Fis family transcriptional regulator [Deltaproteobacteria bacterium]